MSDTRLRALLLTAVIALLTTFTPPLKAEDSLPAKPNVLFLAIDDLNDWIGALGGYPGIKTPNLDRLAKRGTIFTHAYCAAPACNPSRVALLCSLRPSSTGVYLNPQPWRPVLPKAVTLPQHFMANGYRVEGGGKIFHGRYKDKASWHYYLNRPGDPKPAKVPANGIPRTAHFDWGPVTEGDEDMGDQKVTNWAVSFLKKKHDKPFFLAVGLFRPHLPWYAPKKYFDMYPLDKIKLPTVPDDDLNDVPEAGKKMARPQGDHRKVIQSDNWKKAVQGYLASITFTDHCVGQLLDALDKSDYGKNTIIVMWGDHGWHLGEKKHWRKFALWEEATRVPFMMVVPGMTKEGTRCERTVSLLDIYPTLSELCDLKNRPDVEGDSIVSLLKDPRAKWDRPIVTTHGRNNHAVRSERWRYVRYADGSEELYDHEKDPNEWTNLASRPEHADLKKKLAASLPKKNVPNAPREQAKKKTKNQK